MTLKCLEWLHLRNLEQGRLTPSPGINLIHGSNGSGKTSLLECIHLLSRARSFQTHQANQLIRHSEAEARVNGKVEDKTGLQHSVGIRLSRSERELHLDGQKTVASAELLRNFPVLVISPTSTSLLKEGPKQRRQFIDFGVFYDDPGFLDLLRRYTRALSHRNALVRAKRGHDLAPWNQELNRYGTMIAAARQHYACALEPFLKSTAGRFLPGLGGFELKTSAGWNEQKPLLQVLEDETLSDLRQGYTQSGPHRGDFSIHVDGRSARAYLSRGQTKLLIYALLLAQSLRMEESPGLYSGSVLMDDIASELDAKNKTRLLTFMSERKSQFFITATDASGFTSIPHTPVEIAQGRLITA